MLLLLLAVLLTTAFAAPGVVTPTGADLEKVKKGVVCLFDRSPCLPPPGSPICPPPSLPPQVHATLLAHAERTAPPDVVARVRAAARAGGGADAHRELLSALIDVETAAGRGEGGKGATAAAPVTTLPAWLPKGGGGGGRAAAVGGVRAARAAAAAVRGGEL